MNTQPMDEYLNRERLTDLAQFAVPDGHDLWPKIERAARASASGMTTQRPGILSLGLSRAWTAVGILLIAATFAALGFGLAVLVLSNGHDQVPATQPDATLLPTPIAPKASPTPSVSKGPATSQVSTIPSREAAHAKLESILSGETLDRYRALPPAYQEALGLYTWHNLPPDLVHSAVTDKLDQWGDTITPLPELLGEERAERFEGLEGEIVNHARLLAAYYVLVLNTESFDESPAEAMRQMVDYMAPRPPNISTTGPDETRFSAMAPAPMVTWTSLETVLTNTALARLDLLGPRIRERVLDSISSSGEDDIKNVATALTIYELFLLKAQPHLEMPSLEETLTGDDLATFRSFSAADRDRAEFTFQWGLFHLHYAAAASHPTNSTIPKPTPDFLAEQAAFAMDWVKPSGKSEPDQDGTAEPAPAETTSTPDSWVSENGFIQFTTGDTSLEDLSDDPLPGTHPWCTHPSRIPEKPGGPWLVPSKLPEGMEQTIREQASPQIMLRAFRNATDHISMMQEVCAIKRLSPVSYRAIPVGDRTAYVVAAVKPSADGDTPEFDPNVARSLVMDIGYGVVSFNVFGSVTVDELVSMAASLVPEELSESEQGPYPQVVLDALGTSFGPVYVPGKLPDGYEMLGQLQARQEALGPRTSRLSYVRATDGLCVFHLSQAALRQQFPNVVQRAQRGDETSYTVTDDTGQSIRATAKWGTVEFDGVTLYAQEFSARPRREYADVYFQSQGVWFNMKTNLSPGCDHSLEMVAEIAAALEPLQPQPRYPSSAASISSSAIPARMPRRGTRLPLGHPTQRAAKTPFACVRPSQNTPRETQT